MSGLVERMLDLALAPTGNDRQVPPVLSRLRGTLKRGATRAYPRYLEHKYR